MISFSFIYAKEKQQITCEQKTDAHSAARELVFLPLFIQEKGRVCKVHCGL